MPLYLLNLPEPELARGADPALSFASDSAEGFAAELQAALRGDGLFERWKAAQPDPEAVSDALAATDPQATVTGSQAHLKILLKASTSLPGEVLKHRLRLLAGNNWSLADVR
jgi:hypothetical protein